MGLILFFTLLMNAFLADCVWRDVYALRAQGREPWLCGHWGWGCVTMVFGPVSVALYWLTNRSSLREPERARSKVPTNPRES